MDLFPYRHVGTQKEIVELIRETVLNNGSAVIESGTGTGKTVVSLTGTLEAALGSGKKIIYLTRTKSQQKQIISEVRKISEKASVVCMAVQGRNSRLCPLMSRDPELDHGTSEELSKLCSEYKRKDGDRSSCEYYDRIGGENAEVHVEFVRNDHPEPEEFAAYCKERGLCSYELMKLLLPHADVIAAPYSFVFMPYVLQHFLQWIGVPLAKTVIIVDEAHNLPNYLREVMTVEYSRRALELTEKEAGEWHDPEVFQGLSVLDITAVFKEIMDQALNEYLTGDDGLIPITFLQDELMERLGMSTRSLSSIYKGLADAGELIINTKKSKRKLPRSYIASFGAFLQEWTSCSEETHVCLVVGGENPMLQYYCLDPYEAAEPLRCCSSSVHMSGTLEPLTDYAREIGLDGAAEKRFDSPFPKDNLKILYVDDVSTKFDELNNIPETYQKIKHYVLSLVSCVKKNTAVFFPSYSLMDRFIADGVPETMGREVFMERRDMTQPELMEEVSQFRASEGSVLFAVTGGRISEGLDFPDKDLELAILIGIPYPKPTARQEALRRYCEYRFGNGWEHSSKIPAMRKMRQAVGRLIRSGTDRGVAVILDRRVSTMEDIDAQLTSDPCGEVRKFFSVLRP
ncbi:MAG: ATP-dependent DNA helicase [Candidatus Methanoplasma sp.]|jgi:DNA excision repair protein ERCC-2|nr:ATP-dependent DNA helicase [Candidatus Methanoplasma sp.]